jgi:hypothetical protein
VLRVVRSNNCIPKSYSSSLIARDNGDCSMCSRWAARAKCSSSATAIKQRRCRSSMICFSRCLPRDNYSIQTRQTAAFAYRLNLPVNNGLGAHCRAVIAGIAGNDLVAQLLLGNDGVLTSQLDCRFGNFRVARYKECTLESSTAGSVRRSASERYFRIRRSADTQMSYVVPAQSWL